MTIQQAKNTIAIKKGYPSWEEMENFIIDNNQPAGIAQLLVGAMEEVVDLVSANFLLKGMRISIPSS